METFQTQEIREPVESSGVRGEIVVRDFLIPTLTETLPVGLLSPGTVSTVLGESCDTGKEYDRFPVLHRSLSLRLWLRRMLFRALQPPLPCTVRPPNSRHFHYIYLSPH